ncbi:MAG TPA: recombinase family protein [Trebonia sp.]|nr:recombinase family protein [Trebonia sp.]
MSYLGIIRLSDIQGDAQTGPVRQKESITKRFAELDVGPDEIDWAEDLDVSAFHVPPLKRPSLRRAIDKLPADSTITFYRLDRFVRRVFPDFADIVHLAAERKLNLISATEPLDLSGSAGLMSATMLAFVAQMESENTGTRVKNTQQHLRRIGRWTGARFPYGYQPVQMDGKPGWWLVFDPIAKAIVLEAVDRVLAGESVNAIANDLTRRGIAVPLDRMREIRNITHPDDKPTPPICQCGHDKHDEPCVKIHKCRHRTKVGERRQVKTHEADECSEPCPEYKRRGWTRESLSELLRSPSLLGQTIEDGRVLLGNDGLPILFADPLLDHDVWLRMQERLDARRREKVRTQTQTMLLNIAWCDCGAPLYRSVETKANGRVYDYYRERSDRACGTKMIPGVVLDDLVSRELLVTLGDREVLREEGSSEHRTAIEIERRAVAAQIIELTTDMFMRGRPRENHDELLAGLQARHADLTARLDAEGMPETRLVGTGELFKDKWESMTPLERRLWMLDAGIKVVAARGRRPPVEFISRPHMKRSLIAAHDGDVWAVIYLGNFGELLRRASDPLVTVREP